MATLDLSRISVLRAELAAVRARQDELGADLARRRAELAALGRTGEQGAVVTEAERAVAELAQQRRELHSQRLDLAERIAAAAQELGAAADAVRVAGVETTVDYAALVESLDGSVPVAFLPVRIETRFAEDSRALHIRIFPDQIHLDGHEPALTDDERHGAEWYWKERWPALADPERGARAWATLAARTSAGRARYLLDLLRPTNLDRAPSDPPQFPETARRAGPWTRATEAVALPERWVAIGYQDTLEVFRIWSDRVPDRLAAGPTPEPEETPPPASADARTPHVQDALRWAVDPDAAREAGMLLTVRDPELNFNRTLANGLTRLLVIGVDWTLTPEQGSDVLEGLLAAHAATGEFAFIPPGTPTNNTGANRSGFTTAPASQVAEWAPPLVGDDVDASTDVDAGRLAAALGIDPAPLAVAPGAGGPHHRIASALLDALWEATGGYYASEMLEPHGSDALTAAVRAHAVETLYAAGPLPTIRVGPQPYGVLPVASRRLAAGPGQNAELTIHRMAGLVRGLFEPLTDSVPRLGLVGETREVDDVMLDLLQRTPVPWQLRWRDFVGPPQWSATEWMADLRVRQTPVITEVTDRLDIPTNRAARVQYLTAAPDSHPLGVPLVAKGDAGTAYLAEIAGLVRAGADGRRELNLRRGSVALLEALLAFAATQELDKAATGVLAEALSPGDRAAAGLPRLGVRTPDLVRVEAPDPARPPLQFDSARTLAATSAPGSDLAVHDEVARRLAGADLAALARDRSNPLHGVARFLAALDLLATTPAPVDALEWALRGVLDLFSSRLDAWFTSLATARLAEQRAARPRGVHLGCYGWVEDLHPDHGAAAESLGYIGAPSLDHAVTAAVLRSGRQAHDASGAFDIDLSSFRVREALKLLEGVAAGQSLAALVGYRIERKLRDAGLADLIVPLRLAAPLQARGPGLTEPVESIAARDVVDGLRLLAMLPTQAWFLLLGRLGLSPQRQTELERVVREVASVYDAVSDVMVAESVHQTAAGNLDRASAAAGALDRQERPVEPDVVRTPRDGSVVANRVLVTLGGAATDPAPGWPARGARGAAEPRLDRWLGELLGDPTTLTCSGRLIRRDTATSLGTVSAAELGLSPLALTLTAARPAGDQPTELEARIAAALAGRIAGATPEDRIELDGASLLVQLAGAAARLVSGSRPLAPTDLAVPGEPATGAVDLAELAGRVDGAIAAVRAAQVSIAGVERSEAGLRAALAALAELVGVDALAPASRSGADPADQVAVLSAQADAVAALLTERVARIDELLARPAGGPGSETARLGELAAAALGPHQPLLAVFKPAAPAELAASLADRAGLNGGDPTAVVSWLHRASLVRPELDQLCQLLTNAEAGGADIVADLAVVQLPHRPGARWCELPFGPEGQPPAGTVGIVTVAPGGFEPAQPVAGLAIDAWAEVIPSAEHTAGVAFHFDAPGARPPQAIVLAVHPDVEPGTWNLDYLIETLRELIALARLRTLTLRELDSFSGLLPALFLPDNYTRDVPSVSLKSLLATARAANLATVPSGVRGKP